MVALTRQIRRGNSVEFEPFAGNKTLVIARRQKGMNKTKNKVPYVLVARYMRLYHFAHNKPGSLDSYRPLSSSNHYLC